MNGEKTAGQPPAIYAVWFRLVYYRASDDTVATTWRGLLEDEHKFWTGLNQAAEQRDAANQDRSAVKKRMLDLADELDRLACEHAQNADRYDDDDAKQNFHRGCSAALRNNAGRIRQALDV